MLLAGLLPRLLRHSFQPGRAGNPRPENLPILVSHSNHFALAATVQASYPRGDAHTFRMEHHHCLVSSVHRRLWKRFRCTLQRRARFRFLPARCGARASVRFAIVMQIHQERQTLPRFSAFQAKLGALRTSIPAGGGDPQLSPGTRRESGRQFEIVDLRQLRF
jgi:hypothetical protein